MRKLNAEDINISVVATLDNVPEPSYGRISRFIKRGIIDKDKGVANIHAAGRRKSVIRAY